MGKGLRANDAIPYRSAGPVFEDEYLWREERYDSQLVELAGYTEEQVKNMSLQERIPAAEARGRILASASVNCPPAVPIAVCGEELDESAVRCFQYYGIENCFVVTE